MLSTISNQCYSFYQNFRTFHNSEPVQNILGASYFAGGLYGVCHLAYMQFWRDREMAPLSSPSLTWQEKTCKIIDILGDISFILNGARSRPAVAIWKWAASQILSLQQLERLFGKSTLLSPQRLDSAALIASMLLGIPATLKTTYLCYRWIQKTRAQGLAPVGIPILDHFLRARVPSS